jgi:hypothetical protein
VEDRRDDRRCLDQVIAQCRSEDRTVMVGVGRVKLKQPGAGGLELGAPWRVAVDAWECDPFAGWLV